MKCTNCGADIAPGTRFCAQCGSPQVVSGPPIQPGQTGAPAGRGFPWLWIALGCGGLLALAVLVVGAALAVPAVSGWLQFQAPTATVAPSPEPSPTSLPTATPIPIPTTVRVAPDGSGDYASLAEAVDAVATGSTILLSAGEHRLAEPLAIEGAISLIGDGAEETKVMAYGEEYVIHLGGGGPFVVRGVAFQNTGSVETDVILVEDSEASFESCRFTGAVRADEDAYARAGLRFDGDSTGSVRDCVAVENDSNGIVVEGQSQVVIEKSQCSDNVGEGIIFFDDAGGAVRDTVCARNGLHGILVTEQAAPTLEDNACYGNEEMGIRYSGSSGGIARGNACWENGLSGIIVREQARPTLEENLAYDNGESGIAYFGEAGGTAQGNECTGNTFSGIAVEEQAQPTLVGNTCTGNEQMGIRYGESSGGTAQENDCSDNGMSGIAVTDQAQPTLDENVCTGNEQMGIRYSESSGGTAQENECSNNGMSGIAVIDQAEPVLAGNTCTANQEAGIAYFDQGGGTASGNTCSNNLSQGIDLNDQAAPLLEENVCIGNEVGIRFNESSGGVVRENQFSGSGLSGIMVREQAAPTLEQNVSFENTEAGLVYFGEAGGVARQNQLLDNGISGLSVNEQADPTLEENVCTGNQYGIFIHEGTNPTLVDNEAYDNTDRQIVDQRSGGSAPSPTATPAAVADLPVSFRQGDARYFDDPPLVMAYANTEYAGPPSGISIADSGGLWRFDGWVSLSSGQWIEVTNTSTAITKLGVQFWGDANDGWARVVVDGEEKWRGSVYGTDGNWPGGAFVKYLTMTNLGPGPHTVRVEALGIAGDGGGDDVTVYFFGFGQ